MSNASAPLMSLGDSLYRLGQRMNSTDKRREVVLRREISTFILADSLQTDVSNQTIAQIVEITNTVASINPSHEAKFATAMDTVKNLLLQLDPD